MKSTITTERETRERKNTLDNFKAKAKFVSTATWYINYGLAAITSLTYATLNALGMSLTLTTSQRYAVLYFIAMTATPVLGVLGKIIFKGILGLAEKEAKE